MSSSKKKRLRNSEESSADGLQINEKKDKFPFGKLSLAAAGLLVLFVLFLFTIATGTIHRIVTAYSVGSEKVSAAEYNFNYYSSVNSYVSNLQNYGITPETFGLDLSKPLDQQPYEGGEPGETWDDYFRKQTEDTLSQTLKLYLEAKETKTSLPEDVRKSIDESLSSLKEYCESQDTTVNKYLSTNYGKGVNEKVVLLALERFYLAEYFRSKKTETINFADKEIADHYNANKNDFDLVDYRSFIFDGTPADQGTESETSGTEAAASEEAVKAAMAEAKKKADKMLSSIVSETSFAAQALSFSPEDEKATYSNPNATLTKGAASASLSEELKVWLFDASRKKGDKAVIGSDTYYTVVYMISRYRPEEPTVDVRHILIQPQLSENAEEATEEQKKAAKAAAEEIYNTWKSGAKTEDSFAALAKEKSSDPGSAENGGLYKNVVSGQMVPQFDGWIFDKTRKPGDTGIVETDYGFHIMYFSDKGNEYWMVQAEEALAAKAYEDYSASLDQKYSAKKHSFGMSFTGKK